MDKRRNIFNGLVLALDVGVASLGWCMRQGEKILKSGVLIFPESILRKNGIETILTPAALRRKYRMTRRLNARRRLRKYHVLKLLIEHAMCPLTYEELRRWLATKEYPLSNLDFKNWGGSDHSRNPYIFRYRAVHEKLSPYDLGRVFYHLAQRRGFKSSRKARIIDNNSDMEQSSTDLGKTYNEIERVSEELRKRNCTLGEYFYELHEKNEKIRTMHLGRVEHYEKEFEKICEVQQLSEELRHKLYNALFFQRPLRPQKRGLCALEPKHPRTIAGHPLFEEFRLLAFVNNLKVRPLGSREMYTPLSIAQRSKIIEKASQRKTQGDFDVKFLKKLIFSKTGKGHNAIEYEFNYADGVSVPICETSVRLQDVFGCHVYEWRHEYITKNNRTIVYGYQDVFQALCEIDDDNKLEHFVRKRLGFSEEQIRKLVKISPSMTTVQYSVCAIRKILPFLRRGFELSRATLMAKLPDLLGAEWGIIGDNLVADINNEIEDYQHDKHEFSDCKNVYDTLDERIELLGRKYNIESITDKLYRPSEVNKYVFNLTERLPEVELGMQRNPAVLRALTIVRRFVNYLRKRGWIDADTKIVIELAREVNNYNNRMAYKIWQEDRKKNRDEARNALKEYYESSSVPEDSIRKYILWKEQGRLCFYCGKEIGIEALITADTDIEHTVPRSRGGDNDFINTTVCFRDFNQKIKCSKLPTELDNYDDVIARVHDTWDAKIAGLEKNYHKYSIRAKSIPADNPEIKSEARQNALVAKMKLDYWRAKLRTFTVTKEDLAERDFIPRQLRDTGSIARQTLRLLKSRYRKVYVVNGRVVNWARQAWLSEEEKDRNNHTHHAIDAMVMSMLDPSTYARIASGFKNGTKENYGKISEVGLPWATFKKDVYNASEKILVRHLTFHKELKQTWRKFHRLAAPHQTAAGIITNVPTAGDTVRGELHAESNYGKIWDSKNKMERFVIRHNIDYVKQLTKKSSTDKLEACIVDKIVRARVREQIDNPKVWLKFPDANQNGGVEIKKVRCFVNKKDLHKVRCQTHQSEHEYKRYFYADTGAGTNFRTAVYRSTNSKGKTIYKSELINLFEFVKECKFPDFIPYEERVGLGKFVCYLSPGMHALCVPEGREYARKLSVKTLAERLYKIFKLEMDGRINLQFHTAATLEGQGKATINVKSQEPYYRITISNFMKNMLVEGVDFSIDITGEIKFL